MATGSPTTRGNHTAIWTGSRMYVYAGASNSIATGEVYLNSGGGYSPSAKNWQTTTLTGVPLPREGHTAVWTGTEMLVFAGITFDGTNPVKDNDGARYNPATDS